MIDDSEILRSLLANRLGLQDDAIAPTPIAGRVHDHWPVEHPDFGAVLLRLAKFSHMGLSPEDNLGYAKAAFERAGPSGHVPKLFATLAPDEGLDWGGLLVERVEGQFPVLPHGLIGVAEALASLHRLPVPMVSHRAPIRDPAHPVEALLKICTEQIAPVADELPAEVRSLLQRELDWFRRQGDLGAKRPTPVLAFADTHPGNFRVESGSGRTVLLDVERPLYDCAAMDLAHASLPTSLHWEPEVAGEATRADIVAFHQRWAASIPPTLVEATRPFILIYRRLIWLRTTSWACAWAAKNNLANAVTGEEGELSPLARRLKKFVEVETMLDAQAQWEGPDAFLEEELLP